MSRAPRLALAILMVGLGLGLALHMSPSRAGSTAELAAARAVAGVSITVADMDRSIDFYSAVLFFEKVSDVETSGQQVERLLDVPGLRMRVATMKLGAERIELTQYRAPKGRPVPADSRSNDRWFQHIAIIVNDMDQAYVWLRRHNVAHISPAPQRLPDWNPNAGGIHAFYFKDRRPRSRDPSIPSGQGRCPLAAAQRPGVPRHRSHGDRRERHRSQLEVLP